MVLRPLTPMWLWLCSYFIIKVCTCCSCEILSQGLFFFFWPTETQGQLVLKQWLQKRWREWSLPHLLCSSCLLLTRIMLLLVLSPCTDWFQQGSKRVRCLASRYMILYTAILCICSRFNPDTRRRSIFAVLSKTMSAYVQVCCNLHAQPVFSLSCFVVTIILLPLILNCLSNWVLFSGVVHAPM